MIRTVFPLAFLLFLACGASAQTASDQSLISNGSFETGGAESGSPEGWPKGKAGISWEEEDGNRFIRLASTEPGETVMLYREISVPAGIEALELAWKQRVTGLEPGRQAWYDARIMMEFVDADGRKVAPTPGAPYSRRDTDGWVERSVRFLVPEGAARLKFMPSLFQVQAGTLDLDDVLLGPTDPAPVRLAAEAAAAERAAKLAEQAASRRGKAAALLEAQGSLIANGNFETDANTDGAPDGWGRLNEGLAWGEEDGNRFLRITCPGPGKTALMFRRLDLPENARAIELSWRWRVTGLKPGKEPWYDARIMMEFKDASGKKAGPQPSAPYRRSDTSGWVEVTKKFLVPPDALTLDFMPALFQVREGTLDIDNIVLKPTDPAPVIAAAKAREEEIRRAYVPPEAPDPSKWPEELHVEGTQILTRSGKPVWLQGLNTSGLETLPQDRYVMKSALVGIEEWNANVIRVPVKEEFWFGESAYQKDGGAAYRETIDHIVNLVANRGAYVVLDLHRFRAPRQEHADFWKDAATRYKDHPAVLFDLFNEPHGVSWKVWRDGGYVGDKEKPGDEDAFLSEEEKIKLNKGFQSVGMQALVDAVRSTGAKNIVIVGGLDWAYDLSGIVNGYALDDKGGNGIVYSTHIYNWKKGWEDKVLKAAEVHPIFVGEVGADIKKMEFMPAEIQEDPYAWVPDMLGLIQKYKLHWTGWCFHPRATPIMILDWEYTPSPFWGAPAKEALSGKPFELKKMR